MAYDIPFTNAKPDLGVGMYGTAAASRLEAAVPSRQLSIDSLLLYVQTRLRDLDGDLKKILGQQKSSIELRKLLGEARSAIEGAGTDGDGGQELVSSVTASLDEAIKLAEARGDTEMVSKLTDVRKIVNNANDAIFNPDERKQVTEGLKNIEDKLRGNAELDMIEVQSLMGQRGTAVQLATSMLANMNDSLKAIVQNTRG